MTKIEIECCEGKERYSGQCLRMRCPVYSQGKEIVDKNWPHMATGYGNAYGNPSHGTYLSEVRGIQKKK